MTRINSAISVKNLTDEHLLAEHREIKRLPYCLGKAIKCGSINRIPEKFTLGKGHVLFFLDKQVFLSNRYGEIRDELVDRGFEPEDYSTNWVVTMMSGYDNNYIPTKEEKRLLIERIKERIEASPKKVWHYYRRPITRQEAVMLLYDDCVFEEN